MGEAALSVGLGPFMKLRRLRYATLMCVRLCGPIKFAEAGPTSPLFYKGILSSRFGSREAGSLPFSRLFLSGIIIAALLAL